MSQCLRFIYSAYGIALKCNKSNKIENEWKKKLWKNKHWAGENEQMNWNGKRENRIKPAHTSTQWRFNVFFSCLSQSLLLYEMLAAVLNVLAVAE